MLSGAETLEPDSPRDPGGRRGRPDGASESGPGERIAQLEQQVSDLATALRVSERSRFQSEEKLEEVQAKAVESEARAERLERERDLLEMRLYAALADLDRVHETLETLRSRSPA